MLLAFNQVEESQGEILLVIDEPNPMSFKHNWWKFKAKNFKKLKIKKTKIISEEYRNIAKNK